MGIIAHIFKTVRKEEWEIYKLVSFTPFPGEIMEQIVLKAVLRHIQNKEMVWKGQHNFTRSKLWLTALVVFCDEVTASLHKGKAILVFYVDLCKAFDMVSHYIFMTKMERHDSEG